MFTFPYCLTLWYITALYHVSFVWASYIHCLKINMVTQQILISIMVLRSHQWSLRCLSQCCYFYMTIFLPVLHCNKGLKKHSGCTHALFTVDETAKYFTKIGSKVYCSFLDAWKAFDKVLHNGIFKKLLDRGIPVSFVKLLRYWYSNLQCRVK